MELLRAFGPVSENLADTLKHFGSIIWAHGGVLRVVSNIQRDLRLAYTRTYFADDRELELELWFSKDAAQASVPGVEGMFVEALRAAYQAGDGILFYATATTALPVFGMPLRLGVAKGHRSVEQEGYRVVTIRFGHG